MKIISILFHIFIIMLLNMALFYGDPIPKEVHMTNAISTIFAITSLVYVIKSKK